MLAREFHTPVTFWMDPELDPGLWWTALELIRHMNEEEDPDGGD